MTEGPIRTNADGLGETVETLADTPGVESIVLTRDPLAADGWVAAHDGEGQPPLPNVTFAESDNPIGAPSFREFLEVSDRDALGRVFVQTLANLSTEGEYRGMTPEEVYDLMVLRASRIVAVDRRQEEEREEFARTHRGDAWVGGSD